MEHRRINIPEPFKQNLITNEFVGKSHKDRVRDWIHMHLEVISFTREIVEDILDELEGMNSSKESTDNEVFMEFGSFLVDLIRYDYSWDTIRGERLR